MLASHCFRTRKTRIRMQATTHRTLSCILFKLPKGVQGRGETTAAQKPRKRPSAPLPRRSKVFKASDSSQLASRGRRPLCRSSQPLVTSASTEHDPKNASSKNAQRLAESRARGGRSPRDPLT